ncbi:tetratricopeptide repeat protein [Candidatus Woesearchaeota archaeon]|nr:tetratricopeptide repeat protein [Candidatus Woesearchaeota archaeon]
MPDISNLLKQMSEVDRSIDPADLGRLLSAGISLEIATIGVDEKILAERIHKQATRLYWIRGSPQVNRVTHSSKEFPIAQEPYDYKKLTQIIYDVHTNSIGIAQVPAGGFFCAEHSFAVGKFATLLGLTVESIVRPERETMDDEGYITKKGSHIVTCIGNEKHISDMDHYDGVMPESEWLTGRSGLIRASGFESIVGYMHSAIGHDLVKAGRMKDAEKAYRKGAEMNPKNLHALYDLACILYEKGKTEMERNHIEEARDLSRRAISVDPQNIPSHLLNGDCLRKLKDFDGAKSEYMLVFSIIGNHPKAYYGLALLARDNNEVDSMQNYNNLSKNNEWRLRPRAKK